MSEYVMDSRLEACIDQLNNALIEKELIMDSYKIKVHSPHKLVKALKVLLEMDQKCGDVPQELFDTMKMCIEKFKNDCRIEPKPGLTN